MGHHSVCSESDYILGLRRKGEWSVKAIMVINDKYDNDNEYVIWIMAMMIGVLVKHTELMSQISLFLLHCLKLPQVTPLNHSALCLLFLVPFF